jgi:hypothetical protein
MSNVGACPNAVCVAQQRPSSQAFPRFTFDDRASSRVHNPKDALVTKYCDLRAMKRKSSCDRRAKNPKVADVYSSARSSSRRNAPFSPAGRFELRIEA